MYEIEQLVRLAKRENNTKRPYLYVNPLQGKHIPVEPGQMKEMCMALAEEIGKCYGKEKLFLIGFAETATAIAAYVAGSLENALYYENTTREEVEKGEYLYFTESHSHATDQKLNVKCFEEYLGEVDRIVFVEDEVTTGNTICKLIDEIEKNFVGKGINSYWEGVCFQEKEIKFSIASVLNSMAQERITELREKGIDCIWLNKIPFEYKIDSIAGFRDSNACIYDCTQCSPGATVQIVQVPDSRNPRLACRADDYEKAVNQLCEFIYKNEFPGESGGAPYESMLVLGTEECMYPAIQAAAYLQQKSYCKAVKTHSTTRSPIMAYNEETYPLKARHKLYSLYDGERVTYIYNLEKYDKVIIVTDARVISEKGLRSLISALKETGNDEISVYQWI